ncbi:MAG: 23S rRNA (guanosine(2251)-2'-O)-methyltransferase RlmB [Anaerolineales bacterium]|nr:23S rRNA (guanosine(2251)-2'-O)-methyltransferase RlmB [Anaerolineales bacterium]
MSKKRTARLEFLYGRHAVYETLQAGRRGIYQILVAEGATEKGLLAEIINIAGERNIPVHRVDRQKLDEKSDAHHGVAASVSEYPYVSVDEVLEKSLSADEAPFLLAMDQVQDPQNLGALLRTAEAAGIHGVFLPGKHGALVTETVVRTSAGASEHLMIALGNLAQITEMIKKENIWVAGLDSDIDTPSIETVDLNRPICLVVGSEGKGLRRLVRERCDFMIRLPMKGRIESLNASAAGAIVLYAAAMARLNSDPNI